MMSLILNFSVVLHHMQQCRSVCIVHFCRCTNQRDELNIQSQTSTLGFCCITSFPSLSLPVYVLKNWEDGGGGHWLVQIEWCPAGWSVCLLLLIFPCTITSGSSLVAPAYLGGPRKGP